MHRCLNSVLRVWNETFLPTCTCTQKVCTAQPHTAQFTEKSTNCLGVIVYQAYLSRKSFDQTHKINTAQNCGNPHSPISHNHRCMCSVTCARHLKKTQQTSGLTSWELYSQLVMHVIILVIGPKANPMTIILPTKLAINRAFRCVATPVICNMACNTTNLASGTKTQPRSRSALNPNHAVLSDGKQTDLPHAQPNPHIQEHPSPMHWPFWPLSYP